MGRLSAGKSVDASLSHLQTDFRTQAAELSQSDVGETRGSISRIGSWAKILLEGRRDDPASLAASAEADSAEAYIARKAKAYSTPQQQLAAVTGDVKRKSVALDAFIRCAGALAREYRGRVAGDASSSSRPWDGRSSIEADRHTLIATVARLRSEKAGYQAVERKLQHGAPDLDISPLATAIDGFGLRLERLVSLAGEMNEAARTTSDDSASSNG